MTNSSLTHLVLILDRSGSMADGGKDREAENGVRVLLEEQTALPGQLEVTVARFDTEYELVCAALPAQRITAHDLRIQPRGGTALYDAVGRTVNELGEVLSFRPDYARPARVMVLVATDGQENASREFTAATLRKLIERQTSVYGWEFIFMGTSQEAVLEAEAAGFLRKSSYASSDTADGVFSAYAVASASIGNARLAGTRVEVTDKDRKTLR